MKKKVLALALALVLVLSMGSALAMTCNGAYNWACATTTYDCGKGSVQVIPYVKGNDCLGKGAVYTPSTCAGAVVGEQVYFAVKITVDDDPSEEWWDIATLTFEVKGMTAGSYQISGETVNSFDVSSSKIIDLVKAANTNNKFKAGEYYLVRNNNAWKAIKAADFEGVAAEMWSARVADASKAKICATLESEYAPKGQYVEIADWNVIYRAGDRNLVFDVFDGTTWKYSAAIVHINSDDKVEWIASDYKGSATDQKYVGWDGNSLIRVDGARVSTGCNDAAKIVEVMKYFNIDFGTCITEDGIEDNLGWDDEIESCFQWNKDVVAIVNSQCAIEIPKTGDVSVIAYAVMALVAAAGAMGLKK